MNKFTKAGTAVLIGMCLVGATSCVSTGVSSTGSNIVDTLVAADIITLPSINLDFLKNEKIEITEKLLNSWGSKDALAATAVEALKAQLDLKGYAKAYLTQKIPTPDMDYFPITMEELGTLYVVADSLYNN